MVLSSLRLVVVKQQERFGDQTRRVTSRVSSDSATGDIVTLETENETSGEPKTVVGLTRAVHEQ